VQLVYVSGPYSPTHAQAIANDTKSDQIARHQDTTTNINTARQHAIRIWNRGDAALCPHLNTAHFEYDCDASYDDYIEGDLLMVERSDLIYMLPGWEHSRGAKAERAHAITKGIPIEYAEGAMRPE
jgi:hypothetical protein